MTAIKKSQSKMQVQVWLSNPNFWYRIRAPNHFRSKGKWVARFNLFASCKDNIFMSRLVEAIMTCTWLHTVDASSKAFTITAFRSSTGESGV